MRLVKKDQASAAFELPPLPYPMDALAPRISRETLEFHYGKHHKTYVDKLNQLVQGSGQADATLEEIIRNATGALFNNAAQAWNHSFYWQSMAPAGTSTAPGGELAKAIDGTFGSQENLRQLFRKHATEKFGSGWTWLVRTRDGLLVVRNTNDADTPLRTGDTPLLACDVWEHAYYIDQRNDRPAYVDAFWSLANWRFADENFRT
jgi:Fe-Mn family superoxide dismutase